MYDVIVIGGGAAGLFAAYSAASLGKKVILLEKNEKLGKKIYITGKGRCNLTNNVSVSEFFNFVVSNPKFVYSCINTLSPQKTIDFFEENGLNLKFERGNRVFPASDKASDVTATLERKIKKLGVEIRLNTIVDDLIVDGQNVSGVVISNEKMLGNSVIVCTGGISYSLTGSTGDGYKFAQKFGHSVTPLVPSLVGIELKGNDFLEMQGLSLKNVTLTAKLGAKDLFSDFGEMLFTHYGVSGPIVLSCSSVINRYPVNNVDLYIDLKPALDKNVLENRLLREFKENNTKEIFSVMRSLLPKTLIATVLRQAKVACKKNCSEITVSERLAVIDALKGLKFSIKKLRPIEEGIVTAGGISTKEVNPKTMESKLIKGLYFAGEVLDIDAFTGGFNLQLAFSTGYVAGQNA